MAFLSFFIALDMPVIKAPTGMWESLLLRVFGFVANYGWRVVFFTVCLKLLLSPLDIFQRYKARKNQRITEQLKPQLEKMQRQYTDKTVLAQKQMELQRKAGFSYLSGCLPAIITLAIMISLFAALNRVSQYMNFKEYYEMYTVYNAATAEYSALDDAAKEEFKSSDRYSTDRKDSNNNTMDEKVQYAQWQVYDYYQSHKTSFLWIKNIWSPDVPWKKEVNDRSQFESNIGNKYKKEPARLGISGAEFNEAMAQYNTVMGLLLDGNYNKANGYLVLPILSVLLSVATQILSMRQQKQSGQTNDAMGGGTMKVMMFLMPILIGYFSLQYTAAFSLYLVISYAFSLLITVVSNVILWSIDRREKKKQLNEIHKYGRPDPNDL